VGGLTVSTLVTLVLIPAVYALFHRDLGRGERLQAGLKQDSGRASV
jgi:hypothetical protein